MEPIEITVRFRPDGEISVLSIRKDAQELPLISTGRNWKDEQGLHILVMFANHQVQELLFDTTEFRWYLRSSPHSTGKA